MNIYHLEEKLDPRKVGNKAAFLSLMKNSGLNVPSGIVLGNDIFTRTISENKNKNEVDTLLKNLTKDNAKETSTKILSLYSSLALHNEIKNEIQKNINPQKKYAVRSSGIKEDLTGFSFAGQYDTFINMNGIDKIAEAVIKCYLSAYSETALSYLATNGISANEAEMAVIIEEMVDSDISGVAFTVNPISGNDKEILIEATSGQGENLVSGKVSAERYSYDWWNKEVTLSSGELISEQNIKELADTALKIQQLFGYPCDIEFAYEDGILYILQARAITKILYGGINDQWTTADFKDGGVSATVCTPYMWSLYEYIWESELRKFLIESNIMKPNELNKKLGDMFYGRPYWNLSVVKAAMAKVPGYKERDFDSEIGVKITYSGDGATTAITPKTIIGIIRMALGQKKIVKERKENAERLRAELTETYNDYFINKENNFSSDEIKKKWKKLIFTDYLKSESTYFRQIFINTIHQSLYKDKILKHTTQGGYFTLIGGLDNISHLLPFYNMWEISRSIRSDEKALSFWNNTPTDKIAKNLNSVPFGEKVLQYIEKFGYHSKKELDVTYPSFYEDINTIVNDVKNTCALGDDCSPETDSTRLREDYSKEMAKVKEKLSSSAYKKFEKNVNEMRKLLWWREEFRDVSTKFYCIIRAYTLRLADTLFSEQVISDKNDIWFTKIEDIKKYLDGEISKTDLDEIIKRNKIYYSSFKEFTNENEIGFTFSNTAKNNSDKALSGIGCSCFKTTGTARIVHSLDETDRLCEGDILITKFTDTGWTGKFAMLGGIVTEYGGILCHAAIVSREYGIPCVVCAENATKLIKDGQTITINGETGEIILGGEKN
ncbi:MAG: PEP/pyruvate-binding domain-containing protein [Acutalibacteraceae bacterium]|nr:PEP/pyruvate-binding domain-containing protein [Acutalibacteraceae bacterium]